MPAYVVSTPATDLPFEVEDARLHCRVDDDAEDELIELCIRDAVAAWESYTGLLLMPQTVDLYLDRFPSEIRLTKGPVRSVSEITYVDAAGVTQTISIADDVQADLHSHKARIRPAYEKVWPVTRSQLNAVRVRMAMGFASADVIPADIIGALRLYVGHRYEHREDVIVGTISSQLPNAYRVVADRHRLSWF